MKYEACMNRGFHTRTVDAQLKYRECGSTEGFLSCLRLAGVTDCASTVVVWLVRIYEFDFFKLKINFNRVTKYY